MYVLHFLLLPLLYLIFGILVKLEFLNFQKNGITNKKEKKDRSKWTNKFRALGKKKGSRQDFVNLYKEMKKEKDQNSNKESDSKDEVNWKDLIKDDDK